MQTDSENRLSATDEASAERYAIVTYSGDWMAVYDRATGQSVLQAHESDLDPLEFMGRIDRLGISFDQIDRTYYRTSTLDDQARYLPMAMADVVIEER